jgi:probable F420-dependent oxidoreductase
MAPFRFATQAFSANSAQEWKDKARRAEALGYSALHVADHIIGDGPALKATNHPLQNLAAVPAMTMAAAVTTTLRIGCRVFCIDYQHPAVLAKNAATVDLLSEGRLELGLGAGWLAGEYEALGIPLDPAPVRITRLGEVIDAVKALMAGGQVDIDGETVHLHGFQGAPRPVQQPHPPIMVGGGSRRVLELAGRTADIVSLNFDNRSGVIGPKGVQSSTDERTDEKVGWIRGAAAGRPIEIEVGAYFTIVTDNDPVQTAGGLAKLFGLTPEQMLRHPHALVGSVEGICDELERRR